MSSSSAPPGCRRGPDRSAVGLACVSAVIAACDGAALFRGEQFAFRDAGHYYYPLYQRVQQEWAKHHLPLWDASENAGMPLLGNPTAAVLYPGKLVYASNLPYPWAARLYILGHLALALVGMYRLMRGWQTSVTGSLFSAIAYAFGAPIVFQYCNVIYLVGAAWLPFGIAAVDRWLRSGRRSSILALAIVLAMQVLGGDPQSAYVTGLCAGGYAIGLSIARAREHRGRRALTPSRLWIGSLALIAFWIETVLVCAWFLPHYRPKRVPPAVLPWWSWVSPSVACAWGIAAVLLLATRKRSGASLAAMLGGLALAAVLAGGLAAAQLLPVAEYTSLSIRAADDGPHDVFPFSVEPVRLIEMIAPQPFGSYRQANRSWTSLIPPTHRMETWVPSLYLGGATLVLALSAFALRGLGARRIWLSWIAMIALAASLGEFAGPLWVARCIPALTRHLGPHDPADTSAIRLDGKLRDGDGSVYGIMATVLPGFGGFRYPGKMLTFACLGIAGLAGIGLDRCLAGHSRRAIAWSAALALVCMIALAGVQAARGPMVEALRSRGEGRGSATFGPFDAIGAWRESRDALIQGAAVLVATSLAVRVASRHPALAGLSLLVILTIDLAIADTSQILTVPQSSLEAPPELVLKIAEAELANPSPGPFRVHRMPTWEPSGWSEKGSDRRYEELFAWERATIQPKYAIPYGVNYTSTIGVTELYDYEWFFSPIRANRIHRNEPADDATNPRIIYYPRRGFDLWNTRYFVLPSKTYNEENHATYALQTDTEPIAPTHRQVEGPEAEEFLKSWTTHQDWQLVRNKKAFPRAWVVHDATFWRPIEGIGRKGRDLLMMEILYQNDPYWTEPKMQVHDLRRRAFVETAEGDKLLPFLSREEPDATEDVTFHGGEDDQRVEMEVTLRSPGLVILADVLYPGWELTIDDKPAPIWKTNRLMRGAAVDSGTHRLVYRYNPRSVRDGFAASILSVGTLLLMAIGFRTRPLSPVLSASW